MLIHVGGFNLSLVMRQLLSKGTPRGWQGLSADAVRAFLRLWIGVLVRTDQESASVPMPSHAVRIEVFIPLAGE